MSQWDLANWSHVVGLLRCLHERWSAHNTRKAIMFTPCVPLWGESHGTGMQAWITTLKYKFTHTQPPPPHFSFICVQPASIVRGTTTFLYVARKRGIYGSFLLLEKGFKTRLIVHRLNWGIKKKYSNELWNTGKRGWRVFQLKTNAFLCSWHNTLVCTVFDRNVGHILYG